MTPCRYSAPNSSGEAFHSSVAALLGEQVEGRAGEGVAGHQVGEVRRRTGHDELIGVGEHRVTAVGVVERGRSPGGSRRSWPMNVASPVAASDAGLGRRVRLELVVDPGLEVVGVQRDRASIFMLAWLRPQNSVH